MDLTQHIITAVNRYWSADVEILGTWADDDTAACVVYRRRIDPELLLGRRFEFTPEAADGTIEGYARDIAIDLAEPLGIVANSLRRDHHHIAWVVIPPDQPTPTPPPEVLLHIAAPLRALVEDEPSGIVATPRDTCVMRSEQEFEAAQERVKARRDREERDRIEFELAMQAEEETKAAGYVSTLGLILRDNVRAEVARRGWTQADLAAVLGIDRATVNRRLTGRIGWTVDDLAYLCLAFDMEAIDLLRARRDSNPQPADP